MIYGDVFVIGIQLELVMICDAIKCGMFNFVIDEQLFPGKGCAIEFYPTIFGLQDDLWRGLNKEICDIGAVPLEEIDFLDDTPSGIITLDISLVEDFGFCCWLGFDGNEDRFFYSTDYCRTYQEKRYPRGTLERLINSLPKIEDIDFCSSAVIKDFEGSLSATGFKQTSDWLRHFSPIEDRQTSWILTDNAITDKRNQLKNEPSHSQTLFEDSLMLLGSHTRYSRDPKGHIHRFTASKAGLYHWSGSTGDDNNPLALRDKVKAQLQKEFGWECR